MTHVLTGLRLRQQMLMAFWGGSIFDADYPRKWVNIACRLTVFPPVGVLFPEKTAQILCPNCDHENSRSFTVLHNLS